MNQFKGRIANMKSYLLKDWMLHYNVYFDSYLYNTSINYTKKCT